MPQVPIIMPQLGESIAEATIVDIKVKPGDEVVPDQEIIDVETNKAVMGVTTPCKGKIDKITGQLKERIQWHGTRLCGSERRRRRPVQENSARASERNSGNGNSRSRRTGDRGRAPERW